MSIATLAAFALALLGALIGQLSDSIDLRNTEGNLKRLKSPGLWVAVVFKMVMASVLITIYILEGEHPGPMVAVTTGMSADVILRALTKAASTPQAPGSSDSDHKEIR